jgi:hypothetical protein
VPAVSSIPGVLRRVAGVDGLITWPTMTAPVRPPTPLPDGAVGAYEASPPQEIPKAMVMPSSKLRNRTLFIETSDALDIRNTHAQTGRTVARCLRFNGIEADRNAFIPVASLLAM